MSRNFIVTWFVLLAVFCALTSAAFADDTDTCIERSLIDSYQTKYTDNVAEGWEVRGPESMRSQITRVGNLINRRHAWTQVTAFFGRSPNLNIRPDGVQEPYSIVVAPLPAGETALGIHGEYCRESGPTVVMISPEAAVSSHVLNTVSHELVHAIQSTYGHPAMEGWWIEATAEWFSQTFQPYDARVYELDEELFPRFNRPMDHFGGLHEYAAWRFIQALELQAGSPAGLKPLLDRSFAAITATDQTPQLQAVFGTPDLGESVGRFWADHLRPERPRNGVAIEPPTWMVMAGEAQAPVNVQRLAADAFSFSLGQADLKAVSIRVRADSPTANLHFGALSGSTLERETGRSLTLNYCLEGSCNASDFVSRCLGREDLAPADVQWSDDWPGRLKISVSNGSINEATGVRWTVVAKRRDASAPRSCEAEHPAVLPAGATAADERTREREYEEMQEAQRARDTERDRALERARERLRQAESRDERERAQERIREIARAEEEARQEARDRAETRARESAQAQARAEALARFRARERAREEVRRREREREELGDVPDGGERGEQEERDERESLRDAAERFWRDPCRNSRNGFVRFLEDEADRGSRDEVLVRGQMRRDYERWFELFGAASRAGEDVPPAPTVLDYFDADGNPLRRSTYPFLGQMGGELPPAITNSPRTAPAPSNPSAELPPLNRELINQYRQQIQRSNQLRQQRFQQQLNSVRPPQRVRVSACDCPRSEAEMASVAYVLPPSLMDLSFGGRFGLGDGDVPVEMPPVDPTPITPPMIPIPIPTPTPTPTPSPGSGGVGQVNFTDWKLVARGSEKESCYVISSNTSRDGQIEKIDGFGRIAVDPDDDGAWEVTYQVNIGVIRRDTSNPLAEGQSETIESTKLFRGRFTKTNGRLVRTGGRYSGQDCFISPGKEAQCTPLTNTDAREIAGKVTTITEPSRTRFKIQTRTPGIQTQTTNLPKNRN